MKVFALGAEVYGLRLVFRLMCIKIYSLYWLIQKQECTLHTIQHYGGTFISDYISQMCQVEFLDSRQDDRRCQLNTSGVFSILMLSKHWKPLLFRFMSRSLLCAETQVWVLSKEKEFPKDSHKFLVCKWRVTLLLWM